jgi:hypothetical protein
LALEINRRSVSHEISLSHFIYFSVHHELSEEADPCFGKVDASSIDVLKRIFDLPADGDKRLKEPLLIMSARVVGWVDPNGASGTEAHLENDKYKMNDAIERAEAQKVEAVTQEKPKVATDDLSFEEIEKLYLEKKRKQY